MSPRITIHDVAREAGVSTATVDRVLNGRAGVRADTVERVECAARRLRYPRYRMAVVEGQTGPLRCAFVLASGSNSFMQRLGEEAEAAAERHVDDGILIETIRTDVFDPQALSETLHGLDHGIDAAAVVALDHPLVREALNDLAERGVKVVTLVSDVPSSRRARFVGINNFAAGRTAASLMGRFVGARAGKVGLIAGSLSLRDHIERQLGFEQVMGEDYPQLDLLPIREARDDFQRVEEVATALLEQHQDLIGLYNVGAGNRGIVAALEKSGRERDVVFIAHELTPWSRKHLVTGTIDAIINQDPGHEVRSAVRLMIAEATGGAVVPGQERIRIEIFLRDNLP